jgi:S-DNA-T family DNA segregation ATPase FtsK/SpoIIIE
MTDADEPEQAGVPARAETSFEAELDDEPPATHPPVYVDVVSRDHDRRPIVPAQFRPENLKATAKRAAGRQGHRLGYHGLRLPLLYAPLTAWYAPIGAARLAGRLVRWTLDMDARPLQHAAVRREDVDEWLKVVRQRSAHSARRLFLVSILAVPVAAAVALAAWLVPAWIQALVVICAAAGLARLGRPPGKPIITPAVIAPQYRKLNSDIVLRAYHAAKLGDPDKPNQKIEFLTPMADVKGQGCQVTIALPFGKTFAEHVVPARSKIASGLDVSSNQVFLSGDKTSDRRHTLYVAYVDPLSIPAGPTPLLDCKPRDIWKPAPFGLDERGDRVEILLLWISILVGAQPRKGKTFSARLLALYAALDPYVRLFIADGKNSPDWRKFALVADMVIFGTHPNRDGDPVDQLLWMLRGIKKHIEKVNEILSELPVDVCPEGKLTRALARDPRYPDLRVWLLIMEEFQLYYELDDKDASAEIASLLSFIMAVGPSAGVIILSSSQKPSGVGGGQDVPRLFTRYRDNHAVRFALKCGNRIVSEAILGGDAYSEGYDASSLPNGLEYRGIGYLYG